MIDRGESSSLWTIPFPGLVVLSSARKQAGQASKQHPFIAFALVMSPGSYVPVLTFSMMNINGSVSQTNSCFSPGLSSWQRQPSVSNLWTKHWNYRHEPQILTYEFPLIIHTSCKHTTPFQVMFAWLLFPSGLQHVFNVYYCWTAFI